MSRPILRLAAVPVILAAFLSCRDLPTDPRPTGSSALFDGADALPVTIDALIAQSFPKGHRTAVAARWRTITGKIHAGQVTAGRGMLADLVAWIGAKTEEMTPPAGETRERLASRLVLYMSVYVYRDPSGPMPDIPILGGDAVVRVIDPAARQLVVTPDGTAGIDMPAGAVSEPTVLVVYADASQDRVACDGLLDTELCQYRRFYHFKTFPRQRLGLAARVGICAIGAGGAAPDEATAGRLRLAHRLPAGAADYTPGADQADGIEILPSADVTDFLACGTGGATVSFSEFNPVDPVPRHSRFCPTETHRTATYADLDSAIANAPASNMVVVCDGTWPTNEAEVNRPVTIRSESAGGATLAQPAGAAGAQAVLRINGVATGEVRIADLGVQFQAVGIRTTGTFDQVTLDSVRLTGPGGTTPTTGVWLDGSSVATAHVTVTRSRFLLSYYGVRQNEPVAVDTYDSHFEDIGWAGIILWSTVRANFTWPSVTGQSMQKADVIRNTFINIPKYGSGAGVSIQAAGDHLIQGNQFTNSQVGGVGVSSGSTAIFVTRTSVAAVNTRPVRIRDNVVIGHDASADPAVSASWGYGPALRFVNGIAGVSDSVINNSVTGAFIALDVGGPAELTATDNTLTANYIGVRKLGNSLVAITRNDFVGFTYPVTTNPPALPGSPILSNGSLACNWWGSAAPPAPLGPGVNPLSHAPFATAPIANTTLACVVSTAAPPVVRACASASSSPVPTVPTVGQAIQLVAAGGTVKVCDGTHAVANTNLSPKSLTIEGEGPGIPTIDGGGSNNIFRLGTLTATTAIVLRKLRFENAGFDAVNVGQQGGSLLVDQVEFRPTNGTPPAGGTLAYHAGLRVVGSGATVTVQNSTFIGGDLGIEVNQSPNIVFTVTGSTFTGHANLAILAGSGSRLTASGNTISDCRGRWCLQVSNGPNQGRGGAFRFIDNTIAVDFAHRVESVMNLHEANFEISGNVITGTGGSRSHADWFTWPTNAAVSVSEASTLIANGNRITGVYTGFGLGNDVTGSGSDNIVSSISVPVAGGNGVSFTRSDFTDYMTPFGQRSGPTGLRCNWWGSPLGPTNVQQGSDPASYTPWATAPIANSSTPCDPNAPAPAIVRVCSTQGGSSYPTVPTVASALVIVAAGGTVKVCDGTHAVPNVSLNSKSVTIEGEGPGVPVLDAQNTPQVFMMDDQVPRTNVVTLRRLKLVNASHTGIAVGHQYGSLLVDQVEFRPTHGPITNFTQNTAYNAGLIVFDAVGGGVTVQNSTFIGGDIGVLQSNAANVSIRNSTFSGQLNAAIHGGNGGSIDATGNTIGNCGPNWCIGMFSSGAGNYRFTGNTISVDIGSPVRNAIQAGGATYLFDGNVITGTGGSRDPANGSTWPIVQNAIAVTGTIEVVRNTISGAGNGLMLGGATGTATDNTVHDVVSPVNVDDAGMATNMAVHRNDFYNFFKPIATDFTVSSLTCNWWGSAAGPAMPGTIAPSSYTPWATTSIARQPGIACP